MLIIAGLGNPGAQYAGNRHNIGFMALDAIHRKNSFSPWSKKFKAVISEGELAGEKVLLIKPQTFMNLSGQAVVELMNYYKVEPSNMIVIYDDIDLDTGRIRIRKSGSSGTHNGMRNIIYLLGRQDFPRIRIGVSKPKHGEDLANFVLSRFDKTETDEVIESIKKARKAVIETVSTNLDKAMNMYNK